MCIRDRSTCPHDVIDEICEDYIRRCCVLVDGLPYHQAIDGLDDEVRDLVVHEVDELVEIACIDAMTTRLIGYFKWDPTDVPLVVH